MSSPDTSFDPAQYIEDNLEKFEAEFFKNYHGDKDHFEAEFDRWLSDLSDEEIQSIWPPRKSGKKQNELTESGKNTYVRFDYKQNLLVIMSSDQWTNMKGKKYELPKVRRPDVRQ